MKMQYYKFQLDITKDTVLVVFTKEQLQSAIKAAADYGANDILADNIAHGLPEGMAGTHFFSRDNSSFHIIWINEEVLDSDLEYWKVVAHEALHCATCVWHNVGAELDARKNDEVLTYTMNHIMEKIDDAHQLYEETQYVSNREQDL